ncbi:hypothetical protein BJ875DRAFT_226372 [Amylocarpus encephaloides]|uniref:Uncharacterized protein n=1 Tax=Amylocarpus encephaloides TaxID=45428 RepID=A0A9P8C002_9HELO|nr:hypothetical protein BJ875DRAFT_226372 [Amylocarpus encephaloides]
MENPNPIHASNGAGDGPAATNSNPNSKDKVPASHKRSLSGGLLSKLSFLRSSHDDDHSSSERGPLSLVSPVDDHSSPKKNSRAMAVAAQQQKTRRRKGSLRKAALLGRGAQRERKEIRTFAFDTEAQTLYGGDISTSPTSPEESTYYETFGLGIDTTPRPSMEDYTSRVAPLLSPIKTLPMGSDENVTSPTAATSPTLTYTSTTDEDDMLIIPNHSLTGARGLPPDSSGSDSYFPPLTGSLTRRRSAQEPKSPLSIAGLTSNPLPVPDTDWDYSETEWWGWIILIVTWVVFVVGMGSCLDVWSWAWDVGETPYAPPELEDDPTLPIVGYYPALIILTTVMAWVWVVVAWVGMKYFRHAKISGD